LCTHKRATFASSARKKSSCCINIDRGEEKKKESGHQAGTEKNEHMMEPENQMMTPTHPTLFPISSRLM
jgi:hypothetical protein